MLNNRKFNYSSLRSITRHLAAKYCTDKAAQIRARGVYTPDSRRTQSPVFTFSTLPTRFDCLGTQTVQYKHYSGRLDLPSDQKVVTHFI